MQITLHNVEGQMLRVGIRRGEKTRPPLLLFNGIGANIELLEPFLEALDGSEAIIFDVPGVGGSPSPWLPYRPSGLARLSAQLLDQLGHAQVDVLGLSWGGALAQQFAFHQGKRCRRLVLAATSPGHLMVPAKLTVLLKMATPRRYGRATTAITCSCSPAVAGRACLGCAGLRSRRWSWREPTIRSCLSPMAASWQASFRMRVW